VVKKTKQLLRICDCGIADFREVLARQRQLCEERRRERIPNTVLIVEHLPVITLGVRQSANKLLVERGELAQKQIDVVDIRRGGGVTAHNPKQLVFYPILNLQDFGLGINEYIRELEGIGAELLAQLGVHSESKKGFPGLWVGGKKIASIGVRVSKFVTYHGMAINIENDLSIFGLFAPCGLDGIKVTSVLKETGKTQSMAQVKQKLSQLLIKHFSSLNERQNTKYEPKAVNHQSQIMSRPIRNLPSWLKRPPPTGESYNHINNVLDSLGLQTICNNANCPNRGQCWERGIATVLILGNICTRNCKFCSIAGGKPKPPDADEPAAVAEMAKQMKLKYLVITSVDRDDLPDGGASHFRNCINKARKYCPDIKIEILTPDFRDCQKTAIKILQQGLPFLFAHNVETVPSLYPLARSGGDYQRSLNLLRIVKESYGNIQTKSSIMLGLGESDAEVIKVLKDLRNAGCDRITIGQYLKPSRNSLDVIEYIRPEKFDWWKQRAGDLGFSWVMSSPFTRSSYFAEQDNTP
jgi:lipoic acid synthetase